MNICIITCPNGMGHFYRLLDIAKALSKKNQIHFLCSKRQKGKLDRKFNNINFIPIIEDINIEEKKIDFLIHFYNKDLTKIKEINNSQIIISDNLINKVYLKKKFILISNFFWGKNFQIKSKKYESYKNIEKRFLKNNKIIQNRYFGHTCSNQIKKKFINFTGKKYKNLDKTKKNKIFVYLRKKIKILPILRTLQTKYEIYSNIPSKKYKIKHHNLNKGLRKFTYLLARPGFGTISDAIRFNIPILSYIEKNETNEILINNRLIKKYKIGIQLNKNKKNINQVLNINQNTNKYKMYLKNLAKFRINGEEDIINYVKKI